MNTIDPPPPYVDRYTYMPAKIMRASQAVTQVNYDTFERTEPAARQPMRLPLSRRDIEERREYEDCMACCLIGTGLVVQTAILGACITGCLHLFCINDG